MLRVLLPVTRHVWCQEDWKTPYTESAPAIFYLKSSPPSGEANVTSGFFINSQGHGVSVYHFLDSIKHNTKHLYIHYDGKDYPAQVVYKDKNLDFIVVKTDHLKDNPFLRFAEELPSLGEEVVLLGINPSLHVTLEPGYLLEKDYPYLKYMKEGCLRSSCKGGPGYSGGAVVNRKGQVVGVHNSMSNLFIGVFDSVSVPFFKITESLSKKAQKTTEGWVFK